MRTGRSRIVRSKQLQLLKHLSVVQIQLRHRGAIPQRHISPASRVIDRDRNGIGGGHHLTLATDRSAAAPYRSLRSSAEHRRRDCLPPAIHRRRPAPCATAIPAGDGIAVPAGKVASADFALPRGQLSATGREAIALASPWPSLKSINGDSIAGRLLVAFLLER